MKRSKLSRRALLAGMASTAACVGPQKQGPSSHEPLQVIVDPTDYGAIPLIITKPDGSTVSTRGYMVGCPQDCARNHNNGEVPTPDTLYVSPEWMMEIIFTSDAGSADANKKKVLEARDRYAHRIKDAANVRGCGGISKNVWVTQVEKKGGYWYEQRDAKPSFALAAAGGHWTSDNKYVPDAVWISTDSTDPKNEWDPTSKEIQKVIKNIKDHLPSPPYCK